MKNKSSLYVAIFVIFLIFSIIAILASTENTSNTAKKQNLINNRSFNNTFYILASQENETLEEIVQKYARSKGYKVEFEYQGTLEIMNTLNTSSSNYDAVWLSNSIWGYMLNSSVSLSNSNVQVLIQ